MEILNLHITPGAQGGPCTNIATSGTQTVAQIAGSGNFVLVNLSGFLCFVALGGDPSVTVNLATALPISSGDAVQLSTGSNSPWIAAQLATSIGTPLLTPGEAGGLLSVIQVVTPVMLARI